MKSKSIGEGILLWEPSEDRIRNANITRYLRWIEEKKGLTFPDHHQLWEWSVTDIEKFWASIWEFFGIKASKPCTEAVSDRKMPGARWFLGSELNYAEHVFRNRLPQRPALIFQSEFRPLIEMSWGELQQSLPTLERTILIPYLREAAGIAELKNTSMWNILQGGPLLGATSLIYDSSPGFPNLEVI